MKDRKSSQTIRISAALLLAGILTLGLVGPLHKVKAAQVRREVFAPIHVRAGERLVLGMVNTDNQPVVVRFLALNAMDLSPVASSNPFTLAPGTGSWYQALVLNESFVAPAIEAMSAPRDPASGLPTGLKASVQLLDSSGQTLAYYRIEL